MKLQFLAIGLFLCGLTLPFWATKAQGVSSNAEATRLVAPKVSCDVSGPNQPSGSGENTAPDFNKTRDSQNLRVDCIINTNSQPANNDIQPANTNPEDFYGMYVKEASCRTDGSQPPDSEFKIINIVDPFDRENDGDNLDFLPIHSFVFNDAERDITVDSCSYYSFYLVNYDADESPPTTVKVDRNLSLCSPPWDDTPGKLSFIPKAYAKDVTDCALQGGINNSDYPWGLFFLVSLIGMFVVFRPFWLSLNHNKVIIGSLILGLFMSIVPMKNAFAAPPPPRNPNGNASHGYYYYIDKRVITDAFKAAGLDTNLQFGANAAGYMLYYLDQGGYFDLFLQGDKITFLQQRMNNVRIRNLILQAENASGWKSVKFAEASIKQEVAGTSPQAQNPGKELSRQVLDYSQRLADVCKNHGNEPPRMTMLDKTKWRAGDLDFFYTFWAGEKYQKYRNFTYKGNPMWSPKVELPKGSVRYIKWLAVPGQTPLALTSEPGYQHTEVYQVDQFRKWCNAHVNPGEVHNITIEFLLDISSVAPAMKVVGKIGGVAVKSGAQILRQGVVVGREAIEKAAAGRTAMAITKKEAQQFTSASVQTRFGIRSINLTKVFARINLTAASRRLITREINMGLRAITNDPIVGRYTTQEYTDDVIAKTVVEKCYSEARAQCHWYGDGTLAKINVDLNKYPSSTFSEDLFYDIVHEDLHALVINKTGEAAGNGTLPTFIDVYGDPPLVEGFNQWFALAVGKRSGQAAVITLNSNKSYMLETILADEFINAYARRLVRINRLPWNEAAKKSEERFAQWYFEEGMDLRTLNSTLFPEAPRYFRGLEMGGRIVGRLDVAGVSEAQKQFALRSLANDLRQLYR